MIPRTLPQQAITFGFPILIAIAYTNVSDVLLRLFGLPSLLQATVVVLAAIVILARAELRPLEVLLQPLTIVLAVYCAMLFVSSAWADDLSFADFRISEAIKGFVMFVIGASLMTSWKRVRIALGTFVIVAAVLGTISVVQLATHTKNDLGGLSQIETGNVYADVARPRAAGPIGDPNFYGQILLMTLPIAVFLAASGVKSRSRLCFAFAALLIFAGVLMTYSRGAMLAIVAMALLLPFVIPIRRRLILHAAIAAVLLMAALPSSVVRRFGTMTGVFSNVDQTEEMRDASVDKRKLLFGVGIRMFEDAPLFGVGTGNFGKHYPHYANEVGSPAPQYDDPGDRQFPHSLYVELAAENGLLGLASFAAAMAAAFLSLIRSKHVLATAIAISLAGYLVSSLFLHSTYQRYLWLLLAFVPAIERLRHREAES